jgi:hypothetical protein
VPEDGTCGRIAQCEIRGNAYPLINVR